MSRETYITATNCITPLGFDVESNIESILRGDTGIQIHNDISLMPNSFYASVISDEDINNAFAEISSETKYSRLEKMMILALEPIIKNSGIELNSKTAFLLSKVDGLSNPEIAEIMNLSISSVESLVFRAKTTLKEKISKKIEEYRKNIN